jgi:FkbM family methyltransferase
MTFTSYAQNFEDVALWRTLRLHGPGYYIDVGANHPTRDSVTRGLYDRGWRGINIEPVQHYYESLCEARPDDVNLCVAVGNEEGELAFFESTDTGLSTLNPEVAERLRAAGAPLVHRTVKTRTLTSICEEHFRGELPFHFLKIDVEGFEDQVLAGMDFRRWRPWIIVIESPFSTEPVWKSRVLDAGYQFAFFDAINRFYVAEERRDLLSPLSFPANVLDGFQLCEGHRLSYPVADVSAIQADLRSALRRAELAEAQLAAICNSRTWKVMRAMTSIKKLLSLK